MRGKPILGTPRKIEADDIPAPVVEVEERIHTTEQPPESIPNAVVMDPTPINPEVVREARLGADDLIRLGRLSAPTATLTAYVDHDLYQNILRSHPGGISAFIREAAEACQNLDVVMVLSAERDLADRRKEKPTTTTIGSRVPVLYKQRVQSLVLAARKLGIPKVTPNSIVSGWVMTYAKQRGIL